MPHLNKKQNKNTNPISSSQDYHLTQPCHSEEKQTNEQNSAQVSPYTKLSQKLDQEGRNQKEQRIQPWSLGKEDIKHNKLKIKNENAEKYYTNEATN